MKKLFLLLALATPALAADLPDWMAGSWRQGNVEEHWTTANGGLMLGMGKTVSSKRTTFEFVRIVDQDGTLIYLAMPQANPPTPFPMKSSDKTRIVFENLEHDYPQRILYWRDGEKLCARTEGEIDGKSEAEEWCYARITSH